MAVRSRQIGTASSTENKLLQQILKQLERLTQVVSTTSNTTTIP